MEKSKVVYLDFESDSDSDSEDLPTPPVRTKHKPEEKHVVVLSDSSDEDENEDDEDEEIEEIQQSDVHPPRFPRSQLFNLNQQYSPNSRNLPTRDLNSTGAVDALEQWHRSTAARQTPRLVPQVSLLQTAVPLYPVPPVQDDPQVIWDGQDPAVTTHNRFHAPFPQANGPVPVPFPPRHVTEENEIDFVMLLEDPDMIDFLSRASPPPQNGMSTPGEVNANDTVTPIIFEEALSIVLDVLPDICTDFVRQKYDKRFLDIGHVDADSLLGEILAERTYPKQKVSKKRKRGEGGPDEEEDGPIKENVSRDQMSAASKVLRKRFATIPVQYIDTVLKSKKTVYETIRTLMAVEKTPNATQSPFRPLRRPRPGSIGIDDIGDAGLKAQFNAAYQKIALDESVAMQQQKEIEEDAEATKRAFELNDVSDCQCCFDTFPNAKMVICDSKTPHAFCTDCLTGHVKAQMDLQKHEIECMDGSSCKALFSRSTKQKALDAATFARLERIEQQNVLRESGLDLDQCPFCDFAAICPPIEEDRELRCQAPECGIVSCRLCKQKSHIPLTCEEHKKEQGVDERHVIEEEMTKAFLRMCPKCNIPIFKDGGCNKITCSVCHSFICDVCGKDITTQGYGHFGRGCPQSDERSATARATARVKAAEIAAKEDVLASNPDLSAADLEFKMSEKLTTPAKQRPNGQLGNAALADYRMQLELLDQQNRRRREAQERLGLQQEQERERRQRARVQPARDMDYAEQLAMLEAQNRRRLLEQQQRAPAVPVARQNPFDVVAQEVEPTQPNGMGRPPNVLNPLQPLPVPRNPAAQAAALGDNRVHIQGQGVYPVQHLLNPLIGDVRETVVGDAVEAARQAAAQAWPAWPMMPFVPNVRTMMPQRLPPPYFDYAPVQGLQQYMGPELFGRGYLGHNGQYFGGDYRYRRDAPYEQQQLPQLPQQH